jgi:hypothetical protein
MRTKSGRTRGPALLIAAAALVFVPAFAGRADTIASTSSWLPAVHIIGASGIFRTDVWIFNPDTVDSADVLLYLTPAGQDGTNLAGVRINPPLRPRESVTLADIVTQYFGLSSGFGSLNVVSRDVNDQSKDGPPIIVTSNTYNVAGALSGTYGQFSPGQPERKALGFDDSVFGDLYVIGLTNDPNLRTNVAIMNPTGVTLEAGVQLVGPAGGDPYAGRAYEVPPYSIRQINDIFEREFVAAGAPRGGPYRLTVFVNLDNSARVLCYASVSDLGTGDPYLITGEPVRP